MDAEDIVEPDARTLSDLSALADGTLDPERAAPLRKLIAGSPELTRRYEEQRRAADALRLVRADRAPARLRIAVSAPRDEARHPRGRLIYAGALASAVAVAVAALVLLAPGGTPAAPSVSQAATLALRGPVMSAPAPQSRARLNQDVQDTYFPDWSRLGWRAVGQRIDHLGGRRAVTVYYQSGEERIAYTILGAPALRWPGTGTQIINGVALQRLVSRNRQIITWRRTGHTCILSGPGIPAGQLARLAAWH